MACKLCSHYCLVPEGGLGFCCCRTNKDGVLYSLNYGKSTGFAIDPIEKKPFYHFKPGTRTLSFGTPGCNMRCKGCQNWHMSQSPREAQNAFDFPSTQPKAIAEAAVREGVEGIAYTYSEPTIFFEYARDTILETRKLDKKIFHVFVSNGFFSKEAWDLVLKEKLLDAIRIDLKSFRDDFYKEYCGARLQPVLDSIKRVKEGGVHLEVITLLVPGENDSPEELRDLTEWVAALDKNVPLHFLRFFPHYKAGDLRPTSEEKMLEAKAIAEKAGLNYVYLGNLGGENGSVCPKCGAGVVKRTGFASESLLLKGASCPKCGEKLPFIL